jgi:hypothetical protein
MADAQPATDLNIPADQFLVVNFVNDIRPIVEAKCMSCHVPTYAQRDSLVLPDSTWIAVTDTIPPPGGLDLRMDPDTTAMEMDAVFPIAYTSLSGESERMEDQVVVPAFPRRSVLVDAALGVGARQASGSHPDGANALTPYEQQLMNLWVLLGAQYR